MNGFIIFCIVLVSVSNARSQSEMLSVNYSTKTSFSLDSMSEENKKIAWKVEYSTKMKRDFESMEYTLKIDHKKSEFEVVDKLQFSNYQTNSVAFVESGHRFYIDDQVFLEQTDFYGEELLIVEDVNGFDWKLKNESKEILGFTCYLATFEKTGNGAVTISAWYAPELPFPFGPKGYHGLPGLILEIVQNGKLTHTADSIDFSDDIMVIKPTTGKVISRSEFDEKVQRTVTTMKSYTKN